MLREIDSMLQCKDSLHRENTVMREDINNVNSENSTLRIIVEEAIEREEVGTMCNESADRKEALQTAIALMADEVNDYEDTLQTHNEDAQKSTTQNDRISFRRDHLKTKFKSCSNACQCEGRIFQLKHEKLTNEVHKLQCAIGQVNSQKNVIEEGHSEIEHEKKHLVDEKKSTTRTIGQRIQVQFLRDMLNHIVFGGIR